MLNFYSFFESVKKKYIFIVAILFLSSFFQDCSSEESVPAVTMYTVTFHFQDGTSRAYQAVSEGSDATKPTNPTRLDHDFLFWADSDGKEYRFVNMPVTGNLDLYAQWIRLYTITFDSRGGSSVDSIFVREGSNVIRPADPIKTSYSFEGWYTNIYQGPVYDFDNTPVTGNLNLYAKWDADTGAVTHRIILDFNDGITSDQTIQVVDGETLSDQNLQNPRHPDPAYDFYGWYTTAKAEEGNEVDMDQAITSGGWRIYAKWLADNLEKIVHLKRIPEDLSEYDQLTRNVLSPYKVGAEIDALYVDQGKTGGGVTWADANQDIADVIMDSTADASEDKVYLVLVTGETHFPDRRIEISGRHVAVIGGYHRDGNWSRPADHRTVLDGSYGRRLFYFHNNLERNTLLYDIEIFQGRGAGDNASGHGIIVDDASPILWKVVFNNNHDANNGYGGGMSINTVSSSSEFSYPVLIDVKFINNQAYHGGALYVLNSSVILSNVEFSYNKSDSVTDGRGPMYVRIDRTGEYPDMILDGISFRSNQGVQGGALAFVIANNVSSDVLPITLKDVEFEYNTAKTLSGLGGALFLKAADVLLKNVTFANNEAGDNGGAVYSDASSSVFINTTFYKNKAKRGSVVLVNNTLGSSGQAPHSKFINITALDNDTTLLNSGDLHIGSDAHLNNDGGSTRLINTVLWDKNINDNGKLIYINNDDATRTKNHEFALVYSSIGGVNAELNDFVGGSEVATFKGDDSLLTYITNAVVHHNINFGQFQDNGGKVKTITTFGSELQNQGVYAKWHYTSWIKGAFFYYSENDNDWYEIFTSSGLDNSMLLHIEAKELNYVDALGLSRVDRPDLGAVEIR